MIERLDSELIRLLFQRFDGQDNVDVSDIVESEIFVDDNVLFRFQVEINDLIVIFKYYGVGNKLILI